MEPQPSRMFEVLRASAARCAKLLPGARRRCPRASRGAAAGALRAARLAAGRGRGRARCASGCARRTMRASSRCSRCRNSGTKLRSSTPDELLELLQARRRLAPARALRRAAGGGRARRARHRHRARSSARCRRGRSRRRRDRASATPAEIRSCIDAARLKAIRRSVADQPDQQRKRQRARERDEVDSPAHRDAAVARHAPAPALRDSRTPP